MILTTQPAFSVRPPLASQRLNTFERKIVNIFLPISLTCLRCSKEPSHWEDSFEYPQHLFWLRNKKIIFFVYTLLTKVKACREMPCSWYLLEADAGTLLEVYWVSNESIYVYQPLLHIGSDCNWINTFPAITTSVSERSGSVIECLNGDLGAAGSSLTGVTALCPWARYIYSSIVLVQPRKTRLYITERLLMGRKESNQTKQNNFFRLLFSVFVLR